MKNKHAGSDFDDFLKDEGLLSHTEAIAIKQIKTYEMKMIPSSDNPLAWINISPMCHLPAFRIKRK